MSFPTPSEPESIVATGAIVVDLMGVKARPQTLTGLADSPVGLASFIMDHDHDPILHRERVTIPTAVSVQDAAPIEL